MAATLRCSMLVDELDPVVLDDYVRILATILKRTDIRLRHHGEAIVQAVVLMSPGPSTVNDRFHRCWGLAAHLREASFIDRPERSVYEALVGSSEGPAIADLGLHLRAIDCRRNPSSAAA